MLFRLAGILFAHKKCLIICCVWKNTGFIEKTSSTIKLLMKNKQLLIPFLNKSILITGFEVYGGVIVCG